MDIVITVVFFGIVLTIFPLARFRKRWISFVYGFLGAIFCLWIHPWAQEINFLRLQSFLVSTNTLSLVSAVLFVEAVFKSVAGMKDSETEGVFVCRSRRQPLLDVLAKWGEKVLHYSPPVTFLFAVFYGQVFAFFSIEQISFLNQSLLIAFAIAILIPLLTQLIRHFITRELRDLLEFRLLFFQFVISIFIPVLGHFDRPIALFHGVHVYLQFAVVSAGMGILAGGGYIFHKFIK